jgi:transcriptional regulator with GAF, ATPase, and Fis domain
MALPHQVSETMLEEPASATQSSNLPDCLDDTTLSQRLDELRKHAEGLLRDLNVLSEALASRQARDISLVDEVQRYEADLIRGALIRTGGRQRRAARLLNMKIATLNAKIKRYRLNADTSIKQA